MDYPIIFDGKTYAARREKELIAYLFDLKKKKVFLFPKLAIILVGTNEASEKYVKRKMEVCQHVGVEVELFRVNPIHKEAKYLINLIKTINEDSSINGVMVQLPLPKKYKKETQKILSAIDPSKDVDGLTENSPFDAAVARAVLTITREAQKSVAALPHEPKVLVVGASGMAGSAILKAFKIAKYNVTGVDKKGEILRSKISTKLTQSADILVTATGVPFLIRNRNVAAHSVVIDVGFPKPDVEIEGVSKRADFITPVPGGVGPLTVISLIENVIEACQQQTVAN